MRAADHRRSDPRAARLLHVDPGRGRFHHLAFDELVSQLDRGDLLVVNDAATLPGSLRARRGDAPAHEFELRLAARTGRGRWQAVAFGAGDWRTDTDRRPPPPTLRAGEVVHLGDGLDARVCDVSPLSPRLVTLAFAAEDEAWWRALHRSGAVVQYSYLRADLPLRDVQTRFAARPWAVEMPSAAAPLRAATLLRALQRGIGVASLTHAAGLSATGDPAIDARLPLPERYDLPARTVDAVARTRGAGGRIVAVGTTVVRALEGNAREHGALVAGEGTTDLRIGPGFRPRIVDGLLSGMHEPGSSHFAVQQAFAAPDLLGRAFAAATARGYFAHEFGDSTLVLGRACG